MLIRRPGLLLFVEDIWKKTLGKFGSISVKPSSKSPTPQKNHNNNGDVVTLTTTANVGTVKSKDK